MSASCLTIWFARFTLSNPFLSQTQLVAADIQELGNLSDLQTVPAFFCRPALGPCFRQAGSLFGRVSFNLNQGQVIPRALVRSA
jgi:hypothetical protein